MKLYSVKAIKSTEKDLFPAWWHVLALSHPQDDVQHRHIQTEWHVPKDLVAYVYWRQGFINFCFQMQNQLSRKQAGHTVL